MTRLVIVESPTKAKTIRGFLPKGYRVEACMGHVRDLPESASEIPETHKGKSWARLGVNVEMRFEPLYVVPASKRKVVKELKDALKDAEELILATDEDREGESIGWHLVQVLKPKVPIRRMVFHEITRDAILEALENPREVNEKLVRAQETRRILDRLVGYTISPLLWKKIAPRLSAGRVQSVAVRLLCQRELERLAFHAGTYWDLRATLATAGEPKLPFEAMLQSVDDVRVASGKDFDERTGKIAEGKKVLLLDETSAGALRDKLIGGKWSVAELTEKETVRKPAPPFTTSTLQQEANRKLRLSSKQTMQIAQKLYENGYITYMRTDSTNLSNEAIDAARKAIVARYGQNYLSPTARRYATRAKNAQEAHEAIRPAGTRMATADELGLAGTEASLYDMIWKRTIATQMADAQLTQITVTVLAEAAGTRATFAANGRRINFPGFFRAYVEGSDDPEAALDDREIRLPALRMNDPLACKALEPLRHETQPPARYTEASLVQTLEKEGIGRPSTYATIMTTIQERDYVAKQNNQLVPTFKALAVNALLEKHFPDLVDVGFTARMEQELDNIAGGEMEWLPYLDTFYRGETGLEAQVNHKTQTIDPRDIVAMRLEALDASVRIGKTGPYLERQVGADIVRVWLPESLTPSELTPKTVETLVHEKEEGPKRLGNHPDTGDPILLLKGPYGYYVQQGENGESGKPKRASLLKGMSPDYLTLKEAVGLLALPRTLGKHPTDGEIVAAGVGRFGPFIRHGDQFRSLAATDNVLTVDLKRALELLSQPKGARAARKSPAPLRTLGAHPADGEPVVLMDGPYGPYLKHGAVNAKLPKGVVPDAVTLEMALPLLAAKATAEPRARPSKNGKRGGSKASAPNGKKPAAPPKPKAGSKSKSPAKPKAGK